VLTKIVQSLIGYYLNIEDATECSLEKVFFNL